MPKKKTMDPASPDYYSGNPKRQKWSRIENGIEEDDFTNSFLSHFGFMDYPTAQPSIVREQHLNVRPSSSFRNE